jgi:hypothetical protein
MVIMPSALKINAVIDKNKRRNNVLGLNILSKIKSFKASEEILTNHPCVTCDNHCAAKIVNPERHRKNKQPKNLRISSIDVFD